jgi:DNA invertase Pin-like site-specific DNA recombinase
MTEELKSSTTLAAGGVYEHGGGTDDLIVEYHRASTTRQGADGLGIDAQRKMCMDYLNGGKWKVIGEFIEVESGGKSEKERPQLDAALALCQKHGATLLVAKLDRLSRSVAFVSRLMESGIKFVCADQPHVSDLTIHIIVAMAQYEREQISDRVKKTRAEMKRIIKEDGFYATKSSNRQKKITKLGSNNWDQVQKEGQKVKQTRADAYALSVWPEIVQCRQLGMTTMRLIAKELTRRGVQTRARQRQIDKDKAVFGKPGYGEGEWHWHPQQVKAIIDRVEGDK